MLFCHYDDSMFCDISRCKGTAFWKYHPNFLLNSENVTKFAAVKENLSIWGFSKALSQNIIPNYGRNP